MINKKKIANTFGRAANNYDKIAKFQREIGNYLFNILLPLVKGEIVLDAGCGTGYFSKKWKLIGKKVIALDLSLLMLINAKNKGTATSYIEGDIENLPIKDNSVDFCFSNLAIQWCNNIYIALKELYRITKKGGIIAFSTLADGSLKELKECYKKIDHKQHVNSFLTFKEIQKKCIHWRCALRKKSWHLNYYSINSLLQSLKGVGATYLFNRKKHGLMTKNFIKKIIDNYPVKEEKKFPLTYQVIFGILYRD